MTLPRTIVTTGAGASTISTIQHRTAVWLARGNVASTSIESAVVELRERIRPQRLVASRPDDTLSVGEANISTIHGFCLRLLTEAAFGTALYPRPRLLSEDEERRSIWLALALTDKVAYSDNRR